MALGGSLPQINLGVQAKFFRPSVRTSGRVVVWRASTDRTGFYSMDGQGRLSLHPSSSGSINECQACLGT
ncbi:hypothetical protein TNCV_3960001 [Trichonephila clavipes]|nr:hypothetical protein TNCV_3960001 [Trichonephila clavipes]